MVFMGYISEEEIQDSLMGQKYNKIMVFYLLLSYKRYEPEGLYYHINAYIYFSVS